MPSKQSLDGGYLARRIDAAVNRGGDRHDDIAAAFKELTGFDVAPSAVAVLETLLHNRRGTDTPMRNGWELLGKMEYSSENPRGPIKAVAGI